MSSLTNYALMLFLVVGPTGVSVSADAESSGNEESVRVRTFSKFEVVERLRSVGVLEEPVSLVRLPHADGVRVMLAKGGAVEFHCDGDVVHRDTPSPKTYFDAEGHQFAWYEERKLRLSDSSTPIVGRQISVDPNGRYLITTDGPRLGQKTRIYATNHLASVVGVSMFAGSHTRVFSSPDGIVVVGDVPDSHAAVLAVVYGLEDGVLIERERIDVAMPRTWFGGWLVAEDATPSADEILFGFWRDPPLSDQLYAFDLVTRELRHVSKVRGYHAYVACDPISAP